MIVKTPYDAGFDAGYKRDFSKPIPENPYSPVTESQDWSDFESGRIDGYTRAAEELEAQ